MAENTLDIELTEEEYEERKERLVQDAKQSRAKAERRQSDMLDAVASGEEFEVEDYEWVELGNVNIKVRTWLDGDVLEDFATLEETMSDQESPVAKVALEAERNVLVTQTEVIESGQTRFDTEADIREFWRRYITKWGDKGLKMATEAIQEPLDLEGGAEKDAVQSFPKPGRGGSDRARNHRM